MLKLIFVLAVLVRTAYLFIIPAGQTPDEIPIFLRTWDTVRQSLGFSAVANIHYSNNEYYYPPLYFYLSAFLIRLLLLFKQLPVDILQAYLTFYFPLRVFSLVLSVVSLVFIAKTLEALKGERVVRISTLIFLALLPTYAVLAIYPNHNTLLLFFVSIFTYLLLVSRKPFLLGVIGGLAILTRVEGVLLFQLYLTVFFLAKPRNWRSLLVFSITAFFCGGWWYLNNIIRYGWFYDQGLLLASASGFVKPFAFPGYVSFVGWQFLETFVATFGVTNLLRLPEIFYWLFISFGVIALMKVRLGLIFRGVFLKALSFVFVANLAIFFWFNFSTSLQPQGRYLFVSIMFIGYVLVSGWVRALGSRYSRLLPVFIFLFGLGINLVSYAVILVSF